MSTSNLAILQWNDLYTANYHFQQSFLLNFFDGQQFEARTVVRVLPKKRMVAFGDWQGKRAVAKIFFDPHQARRHLETEVKGAHLLEHNKIPSPKLLHEGVSEDRRIYIAIFEEIIQAHSLKDAWEATRGTDEALPILEKALIEIATQHVLGVLQHDMHLNNFLITEKNVITLDGAQIEKFPKILSKKMSMQHLALFVSQLGVAAFSLHDYLFSYYAKSRGWRLKPFDYHDFNVMVNKWNDVRWKKYQKKIFRESTEFSTIKQWCAQGIYLRSYGGEQFKQFLHNPESVFQQLNKEILKDGRSSTVIRVTLDGNDLVIKRYNLKNLLHRLRRLFRDTRAHHVWQMAQKFVLFSVPTATPVAFIEKKFLGMRAQAYVVTTYIPAKDVNEYFNEYKNNHPKMTVMAKKITNLLKSVAKLDVTHGDLKATNILIDAHEQPFLIDLDGAAHHASLSSLHTTWRNEVKRFLKNFSDQPVVQSIFQNLLAKR